MNWQGWNIPLLEKEGWLRHQENIAKPPLKAQTGWCSSGITASYWLRPVGLAFAPLMPGRASYGSLRRLLLMARPPLLYQEGNLLANSYSFIDRRFSY